MVSSPWAASSPPPTRRSRNRRRISGGASGVRRAAPSSRRRAPVFGRASAYPCLADPAEAGSMAGRVNGVAAARVRSFAEGTPPSRSRGKEHDVATLLGKSGIALMIAAVILPFGTESASPAGVPARPTKIVVFGDSLSDTGNAYIGSLHLKAPSPPYFRGRFSNGPIWVEMFARHFGLKAAPALAGGSDFAVGGAKVGSGLDSLPHQADLYLALSIFSRPDPNAVYIIFGGGNDIRRAL